MAMKKIILSLIIILAATSGRPARAVTDDLQQKRSDISQEMLKKRQEASDAKKQAEAKQKEANRLNNEVKAISRDIQITEKKIEDTKNNIEQTEGDINLTSQNISQKEQELAVEQKQLEDTMITIYQTGQRSLIWRLLISRSLGEFLSQQHYLETLELKLEASIAIIEQLKNQLEDEKRRLEDKKNQLTNLQNQQEAYERGLTSEKSTKERLETLAQLSAAEYKKRANAASAAAAALQNKLIAIQRQFRKSGGSALGLPKGALYSTDVKKGDIIGYEGSTGISTGPHVHLGVLIKEDFVDPSGYLGGKLGWPIAERTSRYPNGISQGYGCTDLDIEPEDSSCPGGYFHSGIDVVAAGGAGTPVLAAADGKVIGDGYNTSGYGHYVVIDHGDNFWTLYGHLL